MKLSSLQAHTVNSQCRYCQSTRLIKFLSLGNQPPSNSFIKPEMIKSEKRYPLEVYLCESCYLVQLLDVIDPHLIFDEYLYLSSSSQALKKHFNLFARSLTKRFKLKQNDVIVDIGCNDGILLHEFTIKGLRRIGVEPSKVAEIARKSGLYIINDFFSESVAKKITKTYGTVKLITATNVFAHVDQIKDFMRGILSLLSSDGVFVIEVAYLIDLIDQTLFDTIYHEHLNYLSLTALKPFIETFGLTIFDVERVPMGASGPALRVYIAKAGAYPIKKSVNKILTMELKWGVKNKSTYLEYAKSVEKSKESVVKMIKELTSQHTSIGGYGASAKGNTLLNYFEISDRDITCIAEVNPLKQGLLTPGSHIPIISEAEFLKTMPPYALLLSWNYLDFFLKHSEYIKKGGRFLVPLPKPKLVP